MQTPILDYTKKYGIEFAEASFKGLFQHKN